MREGASQEYGDEEWKSLPSLSRYVDTATALRMFYFSLGLRGLYIPDLD
jgi:hypothetical protein